MPPKTKKPKKTAPKKKRAPRKKTITQIAELPRLPTGANRDIPMGGAGGSSNLLASLASFRPPPPATPIQTPDQFQIMREQSRQAKAIDLVVEEQAKQRGRPTDAAIAEALGVSVEQIRAERRAKRMPSAMPLGDVPMSAMAGIKTEPLPEAPFPEESYLTPSTSLKKASRGRKIRISGETVIVEPPTTIPPVIGTGATFAGGAPATQQGLKMGMDGRLRGAVYDKQEVGADSDVAVFMG